MYNNVVCLGHAHPRVTSAIARQWRVLNTNLRYLHHSAVELAERLLETVPAGPGHGALRQLRLRSQRRRVADRRTAHRSTSAACAPTTPTTASRPRSPTCHRRPFPRGDSPATSRPGGRRTPTAGGTRTRLSFVAALDRLARKGIAPAATILDGVVQSDGVLDLAPAYVQELVRLTHDAGGLWIADEVQGGHGRTGEAMWSFERFGIEPDFVTLGKPMGNGQPVGAVITRRELVESFARDTVFFSTFGGNQVSTAAAHAVLDVLIDERVLPRVEATGRALRRAVREATAGDDRIGDVRGMGLANGIEIVTDRASKTPAAAAAAAIKDDLRRRGLLVGTTARAGNVLKVRPPLAFTEREIPEFVDALVATLDRLPATS